MDYHLKLQDIKLQDERKEKKSWQNIPNFVELFVSFY